MFYETEVKTHIRLPPSMFQEDLEKAILASLNKKFEGFISKDIGFVIAVSGVSHIGEGIIIPGDGAAYYETTFKLFAFKPELQEVVVGKIADITDFGAFFNMGVTDGMIHVSQTMDDYVTFSKNNVLSGKETKRSLKIGDICRARIIAISYKEPSNPKIGLTMRQPYLGNVQWLEAESKKKQERPEKEAKK